MALVARRGEHGQRHQILGRLHIARGEQFSNLAQVIRRAWVVAVRRPAVPDGLIVKRELFVFDSAEDHAGDMPVANRQGLVPNGRGRRVPQPHISS